MAHVTATLNCGPSCIFDASWESASLPYTIESMISEVGKKYPYISPYETGRYSSREIRLRGDSTGDHGTINIQDL